MRTIFAALLCFLLCAAHASAQSPVAAARGLSIDAGLGYAYVSHGESASSPVGLWGGDASITIGSSRLGFKADLAYARAATIAGTGHHTEVLSYLAGPVFHPTIHRNFETYVQVLVGAARISGPVPLGGGAYLLGGWGTGLAGRRRSRISDDGYDRHSHWCGLPEDLLFRSFAELSRPKQS
jgi:hypothetical protein